MDSLLFSVDDVFEACEKLEKAGCSFKKKPDEGRMKGLAFVYDPGKRLVVAAGL